MIISTIATALIQCTMRTQAGWITFVAAGADGWSLMGMLDIARIRCEMALPGYTAKS
jgi:hypothetical protein